MVRELSQEILQNELRHYVKWRGMNEKHAGLVIRYLPMTDRQICSIIYKDKMCEFDLIDDSSLLMSIDDFFDKFIWRAFEPIAEYYGYASWC